MSDAKWRGITRHGNTYRAEVSLGRRGAVERQSFPLSTPPEVMQDWRAKARARATLGRHSDVGTFRADAKKYLKLVEGMPATAARRNEINAWVAAFGDKRRDQITPYLIRLQCRAWATESRVPHPKHHTTNTQPYATPTINKRLRALSNLYRVLDGRAAPNPVRDVDELDEPKRQPRARAYEEIERVIAAMPDERFVTKGKTAKSEAKIRLRCMAYSPITPIQLTHLTPADIDLTSTPPRVRLPARAKGAGAAAVWIDLSAQGAAAYTDFVNEELFGKFSRNNLRRAIGWAAKKLGVPPIRPYDLRHSYLTLVYRMTQSREAVSSLGQHASWDTSRQYVANAEDEVRSAHTAKVNAALASLAGVTAGVTSDSLLGGLADSGGTTRRKTRLKAAPKTAKRRRNALQINEL